MKHSQGSKSKVERDYSQRNHLNQLKKKNITNYRPKLLQITSQLNLYPVQLISNAILNCFVLRKFLSCQDYCIKKSFLPHLSFSALV
jgi:hypothetical protein